MLDIYNIGDLSFTAFMARSFKKVRTSRLSGHDLSMCRCIQMWNIRSISGRVRACRLDCATLPR